MRNLSFSSDEDKSKQRFEVLLHSLYVLGNQNTSKGLGVLKTELSVLEKLELISVPCACGKNIPGTKETDRELKSGPSSILITDQEFDLLYDYISKVPWSIGNPTRFALKTLDWLKNPNEPVASTAS